MTLAPLSVRRPMVPVWIGDPVAAAYAQAGATWWLEHVHGRRGSHASMLARISAGPPVPDHGGTGQEPGTGVREK